MEVIYRLQGLDGEAREQIIDHLEDDPPVERDPEEEYQITRVMYQCGGLQAMLRHIEPVTDFAKQHPLLLLVTKLLYHCCKVRETQQKTPFSLDIFFTCLFL